MYIIFSAFVAGANVMTTKVVKQFLFCFFHFSFMCSVQ